MTRTNSPLVELHGKENKRRKSKALLSKEERLKRNAKGWMDGMREKALAPLVSEYADARLSGEKAEKSKMREILAKFHFWFPYPMKDHEDPTELRPYNAHYVEPEGSVEFEAAKGAHLKLYNKCVKAWVVARVKNKMVDTKEKKGSSSPFNLLMARLSNKSRPPRARSAQQQWQSANWVTEGMEVVVLREWEEKTGVTATACGTMFPDDDDEEELGDRNHNTGAGQDDPEDFAPYSPIAFIAGVVGRLFKALPVEEQARWKADAQEEGRLRREAYEAELAQPLAGDSHSRATCVRNAPEFISKINRGIEVASSLRLTTLGAGPMTRKNGDGGFFMVTTSTNRAVVPMSFQEWYGEEKTKALMEAYKEWVDSCLTTNEVQDVMGKDAGKAAEGEAYTGSLGKGFTTDDVRATQSRKADVRTGPSKELVERPGQEDYRKTKDKPLAAKPRKLRKKAGEEEPDEGSASSEEEEELVDWSGKGSSASESSDDDINASDNASPDTMDAVAVKREERRRAAREAKREKWAARAITEPTRKSSRKRDRTLPHGQPMDVDSGTERNESAGQLMDVDAGGRQSSNAGDDGLSNENLLPETRGALHEDLVMGDSTVSARIPVTEDVTNKEPLPAVSVIVPATLPAVPVIVPATLPAVTPTPAVAPACAPIVTPASTPESATTPTPTPIVDDDGAIRDVIFRLWPEVLLGMGKKGCFKLAVGLGSLVGILDCERRGMNFLLLPFNEFFQAAGGEQLRGVMESLIVIEMSLLGGYMRDESGRRKAVIPVATRPPIVSAWIGNGRCRMGKTGGIPMPRMVVKPGDLPSFVKSWNVWWAELQPVWRVNSGETWKRDTYGKDWHRMIVPGQNGLLAVVAALLWWGSAVAAMDDEKTEWLEAVVDVE